MPCCCRYGDHRAARRHRRNHRSRNGGACGWGAVAACLCSCGFLAGRQLLACYGLPHDQQGQVCVGALWELLMPSLDTPCPHRPATLTCLPTSVGSSTLSRASGGGASRARVASQAGLLGCRHGPGIKGSSATAPLLSPAPVHAKLLALVPCLCRRSGKLGVDFARFDSTQASRAGICALAAQLWPACLHVGTHACMRCLATCASGSILMHAHVQGSPLLSFSPLHHPNTEPAGPVMRGQRGRAFRAQRQQPGRRSSSAAQRPQQQHAGGRPGSAGAARHVC